MTMQAEATERCVLELHAATNLPLEPGRGNPRSPRILMTTASELGQCTRAAADVTSAPAKVGLAVVGCR